MQAVTVAEFATAVTHHLPRAKWIELDSGVDDFDILSTTEFLWQAWPRQAQVSCAWTAVER